MKRLLFLISIIIICSWCLIGCSGISSEAYNSVNGELQSVKTELQKSKAEASELQSKYQGIVITLDNTQAEMKAAQTRYETSQGKSSELTTSLTQTETDFKDLRAKYDAEQKMSSSFKSEMTAAWNRFDRIAGLEWLLVHYWAAAAKKDTSQIEQDNAKIVTYVEPIGDSQLTSIWRQAIDAYKSKQQDLYMQSLAALMDRNNALFNEQARVVREKLK